MSQPTYFGGTPTSSSGYSSTSKPKPPPRGTQAGPGVNVRVPTTTTTAPARDDSSSTSTSTSGSSPRPPAYMRYQVTYRPPVWGTADRQEQQISTLPLVYRAQTSGDLREAYWNDPDSRAIIQAAARVYYRDYPNYSDQWAEGFWQEDILNASLNPGSPPPWQALQMIFSGQTTAPSDPGSSSGYSGYSSYGGSYGGGYGGGSGGGGSVALTDPTSARGLLTQTMQGVLGRDPTRGELRQFLKILNESEMSNPRTVELDGDVAVQSGGIDPGMLAVDFAKDAEDYEQVRGDEFFQTFMRALAGV